MEPCPNCGQPVRSTARFCTSCGYRIPERASGSADNESGFASTWIEQSTGVAAEPVAEANPGSTWPAAPVAETVTETVETVETVEAAPESVYAPPAIAADPIDEIVAATAGFNTEEDSLVDRSKNKINIALYHIETLRQLIPDLSAWSEERAQAVNSAIAAMEAAIKGREEDDLTYNGLRQTVAAAKKDPRDIDVMIALSDRATDIEDLLAAHDKYSIGIRTALIDLKPLAVDYVRVPKRRATTSRRSATSRSGSSASKSRSTTSKSTASKTGRSGASSTARKSNGSTRATSSAASKS